MGSAPARWRALWYSTLPPLASRRRRRATSSRGPPSTPASTSPVSASDSPARSIRSTRPLVQEAGDGVGCGLTRAHRRHRPAHPLDDDVMDECGRAGVEARGGVDDEEVRRVAKRCRQRARVAWASTSADEESSATPVRSETTAPNGIDAAALVPTVDRPAGSAARAPTSRSSLDFPTPAAPPTSTAIGGSRSSRSRIAVDSAARPTRGQGFTSVV